MFYIFTEEGLYDLFSIFKLVDGDYYCVFTGWVLLFGLYILILGLKSLGLNS